MGVFSVGRAERVWPFDDGILVAEVDDRPAARRLLVGRGQRWDRRLRRFVVTVPRCRFPIVDAVEHATTAEVVAYWLVGPRGA